MTAGRIKFVLSSALCLAGAGLLWSVQCAEPVLQPVGNCKVSDTVLFDIQQAKNAAQRDFPKFLDAAFEQKSGYGFLPDDTQESASLAEPVFIYDLNAEKARALTGDYSNLAAIFEPAGEWIFPVQVAGEYRTLFGVRFFGSAWKGAYLGNPYLAKSIQGIRSAWSDKGIDRFKLISCVNPRAFFFNIPSEQEANLTPVTVIALASGERVLPPEQWCDLRPASKVMHIVQSYWQCQGGE